MNYSEQIRRAIIAFDGAFIDTPRWRALPNRGHDYSYEVMYGGNPLSILCHRYTFNVRYNYRPVDRSFLDAQDVFDAVYRQLLIHMIVDEKIA
jgi:hypothetical protein